MALSTLSDWQQGRVRPISPKSLRAVSVLEIPPRSLLTLLERSGPSGWPDVPRDVLPTHAGLGVRPGTALAFYRPVFSWDAQVIPGALREFVRRAGPGAGRLFGAVIPDSHTCWRRSVTSKCLPNARNAG